MKMILIVILMSTIIFSQNTYEVKPGVKNNAIVLELSNVSSTESVNNLEVKLIRSSQNLVFNQKEKMIENITQGTGYHEIDFYSSTLASGVYIYRLSAGNFVSVKKMMVLK